MAALVYGGCLLIIGLIGLMALNVPPRKPDEKLALRKARAKRARIEGHVKHRVHYDTRIKQHSKKGHYW